MELTVYIRTTSSPYGLGSRLGQDAANEIDWCQKRRDIAAAARGEVPRWRGPQGQVIPESDQRQRPILETYWRAVPVANPAAAAALSAADRPGGEWSAAFICFVMRAAGVLPVHGFEFGQRHIRYIVGALRNRERSDRSRPFWLIDAIELLRKEAIPQPGDLLCFNRCAPAGPQHRCGTHPGRRMTTHTYATLRRQFWISQPAVVPTGSSHCALVVDNCTGPNGQRSIVTIGGNEANSVLVTPIHVDQDGGLPAAVIARRHIFGMIKIIACSPEVAGPNPC
jgi:hypothetical protein